MMKEMLLDDHHEGITGKGAISIPNLDLQKKRVDNVHLNP
jgi:hypothetical protein